MRLLLDTRIVLAILRKDAGARFPEIASLLGDSKTVGFVSVASLWETAIRARLGTLDPGIPLEDIAGSLEEIGLILLGIEIQHVITAADPELETRDPFDRLLPARARSKALQLATVDRLLVDHPLALRL
ncbi:twitching motility protein PilT [Rhizobium esperanzae]|uniref:Twitching motility protein PilT n=1 Tax=Rhizobium esperanzae TaxID=1967781 RepID=A0A2D0ABH2_9HYPH|nr:PIN domain-containing protein [Rhizobium esperanzae]OWO96217.1 twitching motility protein PilT [Rhizobium esperanzae]